MNRWRRTSWCSGIAAYLTISMALAASDRRMSAQTRCGRRRGRDASRAHPPAARRRSGRPVTSRCRRRATCWRRPEIADLEELVEHAREDRQEVDPLEERIAGVGGLVQDPSGVVEPGQLAVDVRPLARSFGARPGSVGDLPVTRAAVLARGRALARSGGAGALMDGSRASHGSRRAGQGRARIPRLTGKSGRLDGAGARHRARSALRDVAPLTGLAVDEDAHRPVCRRVDERFVGPAEAGLQACRSARRHPARPPRTSARPPRIGSDCARSRGRRARRRRGRPATGRRSRSPPPTPMMTSPPTSISVATTATAIRVVAVSSGGATRSSAGSRPRPARSRRPCRRRRSRSSSSPSRSCRSASRSPRSRPSASRS